MKKSNSAFHCSWFLVFASACSGGNDTAISQSHPSATGGEQASSGGNGAAAGSSTWSGGSVNSGGAKSAGGSTHSGGASSSAGGASSSFCGSDPCTPTRCAGIGCGPAVCCHGPNGPVCIHGASECPASDGGVQTESLACFGGTSTASFTKSCVADTDCFVAAHYEGCCNLRAIGLNAIDDATFASFEKTCGTPVCGCCCDRTTTEDGVTVAAGGTVSVACINGQCRTKTP